ncbi:hypothetical protein VX159_13815 [Dechloromonas sp. ZY10]|uniref:hypothetical protein n=1 Tax=Dechloromonas aquae TaxID=2664436 RepID=UPI0035283ED0
MTRLLPLGGEKTPCAPFGPRRAGHFFTCSGQLEQICSKSEQVLRAAPGQIARNGRTAPNKNIQRTDFNGFHVAKPANGTGWHGPCN